jgi:short-subunit dehydrogenase
MKYIDYTNKVIVITGAASGIGAELAKIFAANGGRIALLDFDLKSLDKFTTKMKNKYTRVFSHLCDVSSQDDCIKAIQAVILHWGRIDILINNAGITQRGSFLDTDISVFRKVMEVNFFGSLYCTKAALPQIIDNKGAIVVMESVAGVTPLPGRTGYCASKHALHGLFSTLRTELRNTGVHVMNVCPGFIKTNLQTRALGTDGNIACTPRSTIGNDASPVMVATAVLKGLEKRRNILAMTIPGKLAYWLNRIWPTLFERIIEKQINKE